MIKQFCKWQLNISHTKCYARTYSPSCTKWNIFKVYASVINWTIKESFRYFISIDFTSLTAFSWNKKMGPVGKDDIMSFHNLLASSGEDTITLESSPSCKCIKGPYVFAKFLEDS
ncbi:hypothetical protein O6P43_021271 [Quillaja saponaria]|uniref:Uncharacterized protein n=1 Tax=Quillaja saponaria TaxID=32244 RepID=A0AAD7LMK2_QUISA|nr:hypothetical protein O6P43_021271 [Quillaja saponaria]